MRNIYMILMVAGLSCILIGCNDATKKEADSEKVEETAVKETKKAPPAEKKELSDTEKKQVNSVMTKVMVTPEAKTFTSALVTAGLTNILSKQQGPFTVFAPSNTAFENLGEEGRRKLLSPAQSDSLQLLLKNHIVQGMMSSSDLVQQLKAKGSITMNTIADTKLTAKMEGSQIVVQNEVGKSAVIGKSDIEGSNGTVHLLDSVLQIN
ncbi:fasciclin domain-containing protein [Luteirhabdus pelagi]|uniref:fasciclin domain-containing protein n=1 Tax=Luteirhabdus pelagi TaxID=2792783 RepID=UPI001939A3C1|nr:fasciclin domain-containing protein [Luteirhabdus pelagi]